MDFESTRTAASTITPSATQTPAPTRKYGEDLLDYYVSKSDSLVDEYKSPESIAKLAYEKASDKDAMDYDTWSSFHGVNDFIAKAPTEAESRRKAAEFEAAKPEDRGFLAGTGAALGRGAMNVGSAVGQTAGLADLTPASIDTDKGYLDRVGEGLVDWAEKKKETTQFMRPTKQEDAGEVGPLQRWWEGSTESLVTSSAPLAAGYVGGKAGAAVGSAFGPVGTAAGTVIGAGGAYLLARAGLFGAGIYGDTYDKTYKELKQANPGLTEDEVRNKANVGAWIDTASETITEMTGDAAAVATFGGTKLVTQPLKATLKEFIKQGIGGYIKATAKQMPFEAGSEMANAYVQHVWRKKEGLDAGDLATNLVDAGMTGAFMSLTMGGASAGMTEYGARKTIKALNSEDQNVRAEAANHVTAKIYEATKDKDVAEEWRSRAFDMIEAGEEISIDRQLAEFGANKARAEAAERGEEIAIEPDGQDQEPAAVDAPTIDQPTPKSEAEQLLTDGADVTPEQVLLGQDEEPISSEPGQIEGSSQAVGSIEDASAQGLQPSQESQSAPLAAPAWAEEQDLDKRWAMAQDERDVAAQDKMLAVEIDAGNRLMAAKNVIAQVDAKKGKAKKPDLVAKQAAQREIKQITAQYPQFEAMLADPTRNMVPTTEEARALAGTLPVAPAPVPQMDKQSAAAISKTETQVAKIEKTPPQMRSAKNKIRLENLKLELASLKQAAQPIPLAEGDYGQAATAVGGMVGFNGQSVDQGVGGQVGAVPESVQVGISERLQPGIATGNTEQGGTTLDEITRHAEGIHDRLVAEGVLTQDEVDQIRTLDVEDPEYVISASRQELIASSHVQTVRRKMYDRTIGRIVKGGGIHPGYLTSQHGNDGAQWLRSRFGIGIVSNNGNALDVWAQILSEEVPEADIRGDADRLYSLLRDDWQNLKKINGDYRDYANSLREDIKTAKAKMDEREAYRQGNLTTKRADLQKKLDNLTAPEGKKNSPAREAKRLDVMAQLKELDEASRVNESSLDAEARGAEEFGPATISNAEQPGVATVTAPVQAEASTQRPDQFNTYEKHLKDPASKGVGLGLLQYIRMDTSLEDGEADILEGMYRERVKGDARSAMEDGKDMTLVEARQMLTDVTNRINEQGQVADARLLDRQKQIKALVQKLEAEEAPTPFDSKAWNKERDDTIKASKASGVKHLDDVPAYVETMRGKEIYNVHDPKERGTVRTVSNNGDVVVKWKDKYSADKNMGNEWLMPTDLKDYAFAQGKEEASATFDEMVKDAARWRGAARNLSMEIGSETKEQRSAALYLSRMTTKGDLDAYLMRKYGLAADEARNISNSLTARGIRDDTTATVEEFKDEPWAKEFSKYRKETPVALTTAEPKESQPFTLKPISEKAFVVVGDTKPIKDKLKSAGGKWMSKYGGWMFPERHRAKIEKLLGLGEPVRDDVLEQSRGMLLDGYNIDVKEDAAGKTYKMVAPDGSVLTYVSPSASTLPQKHADQLMTAMVEHFTGDRKAPDREMDPVLSLTSSDGEARFDVVQRKDGKFAVAMRDIDTEKSVSDVMVYSTQAAAERYARDEFKKYEDANKPATEEKPVEGMDAVVDHFAKKLYSGAKYTNIVQARKEAAEIMGEKVQGGTELAKVVDEAIELAIVKTARRMIREMRKSGASDLDIYRDLVALYGQQPTLGVRTSTSAQQQAYSTPVPIAFLASRLAGIKSNTRVLEPTAGNGMLLIEADNPVANELNPARAAQLRSLGFKVGEMDAASEEFIAKVRDHVDAVIANPPFGRIRDENGEAKSWTVAGYETKELDHAIALRSLELLLPDGKAVLIIGGKQGEGKNRALKYHSVAQRQFYNALFENFKVVDHFTVDGKLYSKQGAGFPIDIIVIDGRGKTTGRKFPAAAPPMIYESFEALEEKFNEQHMGSGNRIGSGDADVSGGMDGDRQPGKSDSTRGGSPAGVDTAGGRTEAGSQGLSDSAGRSGVDRSLRGREGAGEGEQTGDLQSTGQAGTTGQAARPGGREQEGLSPQAKPADTGLVQRNEPAGLGDSGNGNISLDALMGEWDRQEEAAKPKQEKPTAEKSAAQVFADNKAELKANLAAALDAFSKFGGMSVQIVKDGDKVNQSLYEAIRPHLLAAYQNLKAMGMAGQQLMREFVAQARAVFGDKASQARPYFEKFAGEIVEMERKAEAPVKTQPKVKTENGQAGTALQDPYTPRSNSSSMGTLVPKNMTTPLRNALDKLEAERGNIDDYVAKELGYSKKEMEEYFAGEQIDAIALAIHNIDKGAGFIIGDQTGIGKGRVNAAIMRYAKRIGAVPVFVTMKPDLYADMVRDLQDIGMKGFNPLVTNAGLTGDKAIPLPDGRTLRTAAAAKHTAILNAQGKKGVSDYDAVFTTYSQLQSVKGADTQRRSFIRDVAANAVFILDESHNAGGSESAGARKKKDAAPTTAEFIRIALGMTEHGTFYSSATYAKRPDVMSLYFKTDMRYAVDDIGKLASAISEGGIPLQQIVAAQLTEAGQYIRRERSFEGASVEVAPAKADMKAAEQSATIMRSILAFDKIKQEALAAVNDAAMAEGEAVGDSSAVGEKGASSTTFTSVMHNLIGQSLLAMKADAAVDAAIEAKGRGEKPIITLANTMGSFIKEHVDAENITPGQEVFLTFKDLYRRYLEKTRTLTKRDPRGKIIEQRVLTDDELGPEGVAAYNAVLGEIERSNFGDLPISPIDHIKSRLEAAGISVGEITGRTATVDYSGGIPVYRPRRPSPAGNIEVMRSFNSGETDVIILNQSGSTGISLHSSSTFADTNKRTMIIVQPELNIDVFMQTLGRVFRTGQVVPPAYKLLTSDLPAEKRPAAVLGKKMAGLNANTTASRKTDTTFQNIPDFLNEYGDLVTAQIMEENPEIHKALGSPLKEAEGGYERDGAVRKVTGRIPMLPLKDQQELYDMIEGEYSDLIAQLEATGTSTLEAKTLPLDAKLLSSADLTSAKEVGGDSPFAAESKVGYFDVKSLGRPYSPDQVRKLIEQGQTNVPDIEKTRTDTVAWLNKRLETIKDEDAKANIQERVGQQYETIVGVLDRMAIGAPVVVSTKDNTYEGVVVKLEHKGSANPSAPSSWRATIAIADAARQIIVPFSKIQTGYGQDLTIGQVAVRSSNKSLDGVLESFSKGQTLSREKRYIAYGNVLAAYSSVGNQGQIVNFGDSDGNTRAGIMFKKNATLNEIVGSADVSVPDFESMERFFAATSNAGILKSADKNLVITSSGGYWTFLTAPSRAKGGQFYLNGKLIEAAGREFVKGANGWKLTAREDVAKKMIDVLRQQGFGIIAGSHLTEARDVMGLKKKDEAKAAPQYQTAPKAPSSINLRAAFPWADSITKDGDRHVVTKGKVSFAVKMVDTITPDKVAFELDYRRAFDPKTDRIAGEYKAGSITVSRAAGNQWTLSHEFEHFLEDMGLITRFEQAVLDAAIKKQEKAGTLPFDAAPGGKRMAPAELRAYFVQHALEKRDFQRKTTLGRVLQKVVDFVDALVNLAVRTSKGVVRDVESGKVMGRSPEVAEMGYGQTAYEAKQKAALPKRPKKYGVGKLIGGELYLHKSAIDALPQGVQDKIAAADAPFDWTIAKWNEKSGNVSLLESKDWDTAAEPTVGRSYLVDSGKIVNPPSDPWIYHHKWLFVRDDYKGFDVEASKRRSEQWMSVDDIDYKRIGKKSFWESEVLPQLTLQGIGAAADDLSQAIGSADTSLNQVASTFKHKAFRPGDRNLDIGGGRWSAATDFLAAQGIENNVFDPYNRDTLHNTAIVDRLRGGEKFPTVTVNNVLNVIAEQSVRENVAKQAAKAVAKDGTAYFLIYEGSGKGEGKATSKGWQNNAKAKEYLAEVGKHFSEVKTSGNLIIATGPKDISGPAIWDMGPGGEGRVQYSVLSQTLTKGKELASDIMARPETFGKLNFINTQLHKSLKHPAFRKIFERFHAAAGTQARAAARSAELAPDILPDHANGFKQTVNELIRKGAYTADDLRSVSRVMSMGTLAGKNPSPFAGHRLTEDELASLAAGETIQLGGKDVAMSKKQVKLYRQGRAALDQMIQEMATSEAWSRIRGTLTDQTLPDGSTTSAKDLWQVFADSPIEAGQAMESLLAAELNKAQARLTQAEMDAHALAGVDTMEDFANYGRDLHKLVKAQKNVDKFSKKQLEDGDLDEIIAKREEKIEAMAEKLGIDPAESEAELKKFVAAAREYKAAAQQVENVKTAQEDIGDVFDKSQKLINAGYVPLSRFGKYRINVNDAEDKLLYVAMFDTSTEANQERRKLVGAFANETGAVVGPVTRESEEAWKLYQGQNPEAMMLFAKKAGADEDETIQAYYRNALSSRSALKRLINRQGYAGYSDDMQRILASFITSGAKRVGANYHAADITEMVADENLPGDVKDEAVKLKTFVDNPGDAGSGFRSFAANWYMLGSLMSAAWNGTQVVTSTLPELYKYSGSVGKSAKDIWGAYRTIVKRGGDLSKTERDALKKAEQDGTVDAAEVHHLYAMATKRFVNKLGGGEVARKTGAFLRLWGMPFAWFETMNRKATFIAAFRMAEDQNMDDPYSFAKQIVDITQGIYAKQNRPNLARGGAGGAVLTFMQYKIMTLEQISRNMKEGGQARKAAALQLAIIAAMGGWAALPGVEDFMDLLDAIMQIVGGEAWLTKKKLKEAIEKGGKQAAGLVLEKAAADAVGQFMADFVNTGVSAALPVDVSGRAAMGGIIPGMKLLKPSTQYRDSEIFEMAGVPGSMIQSLVDATSYAFRGDVGRAAMRLAPNAVANAAKGVDILATGEIRNTTGKKVTDGSIPAGLAQMVGAQPKDKTRIGGRLRDNQELKYLTQQEERSIINQWADAYEQKGVVAQAAALKEARDRITKWNATNPDWPIVVKQSQVMRELQNRKKTTVELATKSAPKELRKSMAVQ